MKRGLAFIIIFILLINIVLAVDAGDEIDKTKQDLENVTNQVKEISSALEEQREIPESLQAPARYIFGIDGEISFSVFIIYSALFFMIFVILYSFSGVITQKKYLQFLISLVVTILIAISRGVKIGAEWLIDVFSIFETLNKYSYLKLSVILAIIIVIGYFVVSLYKLLKNQAYQEYLESAGTEAGLGANIMRRLGKRFKKTQ